MIDSKRNARLPASILLVTLAVGAGAFWGWQVLGAGQDREEVRRLLGEARDLREFQKKPSEALVLLRKARKLDPDHWEVLYESGRALLEVMQVHDAIEALGRAEFLCPEPRRPEISLYLGHAYRQRYVATGQRGDYNRALRAFETAQELPEQEAEALYHAGFLALGLERTRAKNLSEADLPKAKGFLELLVERHPQSEHVERANQLLGLIRDVEERK